MAGGEAVGGDEVVGDNIQVEVHDEHQVLGHNNVLGRSAVADAANPGLQLNAGSRRSECKHQPHGQEQVDQRQQRGIGAACLVKNEHGQSLLSYCLELQSVLLMLSVNQVRGDFMNSLIIQSEDPGMTLYTLDCMRRLLVPEFKISAFRREMSAEAVATHLQLLLNEDEFFSTSLVKVMNWIDTLINIGHNSLIA